MYARSDSVDSARRARGLTLRTALAPGRRLRLRGSRYELGYQHGVAHGAEMRRFLADRLARLEPLVGAEKAAAFPPTVAQYKEVIEATLPAMAEELRGLAKGAGVTLENAYLLQLRRELVGYQSVRPRGDCTVFARLAADGAVMGQTIDLNGHMAPELTVMEVEHEGGRRLTLASFTGLLGYLGMNDSGLAIGLSLVLGGEWRPGIPGYMAIRHLLDEAATVEECLELLRRLPLASSRALTICDGTRVVTVEYILDEMVVLEGDEQVHTNHFLHSPFAARDELNPFARGSSLRRLDACASALERVPAGARAEDYFAFLERPPIYVAPKDDIRREYTVGSVVMYPGAGAMFVREQSAGAH